MPEYHPLDVRYKGPSTAYRGSAHKRKFEKPAPAQPRAKPEAHTKPTSPAPEGPWASAQPATTQPPRPQTPPKSSEPRLSPMGAVFGIFGVFRTIYRTVMLGYLAIVVIVFFVLATGGFFSGLGGLTPMETEMISISPR